MDVDRFFTFGPETPFQAHEVFTDREQYIAAYSERVRTHRERSWSDAELTNFQRSAHNIMAVVGEGGIGKSALLRHLARLTQDGKLSGLPKHRAVALIDFADPDNQSFEAVLWRVRAAVGRLARSWPAFDIAFALYWERKGGTMADLARWSAHSGHNRELSGLGQQIVETSVVGTLGGGIADFKQRLDFGAAHRLMLDRADGQDARAPGGVVGIERAGKMDAAPGGGPLAGDHAVAHDGQGVRRGPAAGWLRDVRRFGGRFNGVGRRGRHSCTSQFLFSGPAFPYGA